MSVSEGPPGGGTDDVTTTLYDVIVRTITFLLSYLLYLLLMCLALGPAKPFLREKLPALFRQSSGVTMATTSQSSGVIMATTSQGYDVTMATTSQSSDVTMATTSQLIDFEGSDEQVYENIESFVKETIYRAFKQVECDEIGKSKIE